MAQLSPGVQVNEINLSIIVPQLGNSTAAFGGNFNKGPIGKETLITNTGELYDQYGTPTNTNFNDFYQAYNFLQYSDKLLLSRAADTKGTYSIIGNKVKATELGKVELDFAPTELQAGSIVKFDPAATTEYTVQSIETNIATAVAQVETLTINTVAVGDYTLNITDGLGVVTPITYTAIATDTTSTIATSLGALLEAYDTSATNISVSANVITITASVPGIATTDVVAVGDMTLVVTVPNVVGDYWKLVFDTTTDFNALNLVGSSIYLKDSILNALTVAPIDGGTAKTAAELKLEAIFIGNADDYSVVEASIPMSVSDKIKFIAKSAGISSNGIEIGIAREADFTTGASTIFKGVIINDLFETKPLEAKKEIAIVIRNGSTIDGAYIVSLIPGTKDYRGKSIYIEDIINKFSTLVYAKDNTSIVDMPASRLYIAPTYDAISGAELTPEIINTLITSNASEGVISASDILDSYGNVSENTIFGNKETLDIDIVIANETYRKAAGSIASGRKDCIAFIGSRFEDTVGLKSALVVENLTKDVLTGELNAAETANDFCAFFGNYKYQYDQYNDKMRWVSVAGDIAGLRASTNTSLNTWWASAGLDRGQIKNANKIAFNPNSGQRDFMYKNRVNPIISLPGQGNAIVWGQKTLTPTASSFDRINVRGLFNTLERAISRMAKVYLFEFNDEFTRNRFVAAIRPFLQGVQSGRGIYDFFIECNEKNNTPAVIDANQFVATIAIKPTRVAEFITLNFVSVGTGVSFSEVFA